MHHSAIYVSHGHPNRMKCTHERYVGVVSGVYRALRCTKQQFQRGASQTSAITYDVTDTWAREICTSNCKTSSIDWYCCCTSFGLRSTTIAPTPKQQLICRSRLFYSNWKLSTTITSTNTHRPSAISIIFIIEALNRRSTDIRYLRVIYQRQSFYCVTERIQQHFDTIQIANSLTYQATCWLWFTYRLLECRNVLVPQAFEIIFVYRSPHTPQ